MFLDYAVLGDDIVIADERVAEEYQKIMRDAEVTISKEKSLVSRSGAAEFAKRFMTDGCSQDLSPVSATVCSLFGGFVAAFHFLIFLVSLQTSYRLRGAGYRTYSSDVPPKGKHRRWLRHWLLAHSPSGILPYPVELWLTLPEKKAVDPYRLGMVIDFVKSRIAPRDFDPGKFDKIRVAYQDQWFDPVGNVSTEDVF